MWAAALCGVAPVLAASRRRVGLSLQTYSQLAYPIQQAKALGLQFHSRILDIDNIDVSTSRSRGPGHHRGWELWPRQGPGGGLARGWGPCADPRGLGLVPGEGLKGGLGLV